MRSLLFVGIAAIGFALVGASPSVSAPASTLLGDAAAIQSGSSRSATAAGIAISTATGIATTIGIPAAIAAIIARHVATTRRASPHRREPD